MNKNIDKNSYKEASYGKKQLTIVSIIIFVLAVVALVGGIALLVNGIKVHGVFSKIWRIILACILVFFGVVCGYASIMAFFTSLDMLKNKNMNVKDGNRAVGTLNVLKCDKCGHEVEEGAEFCKNCGASLSDYIECECGTRNPKDAEFCSSCGQELIKNNKKTSKK